MKSPMVTNADYIADKSGYTDLQVLCSAAGYYVGTMYEERDATGKVIFQEPGSRDSGYFNTREEAEALLRQLKSDTDANAALILRQHP